MKAVLCQSDGISVIEKPAPLGEGVLVRVAACGICGSELSYLKHGLSMSVTPGHEISGTLSDGTAVAIEPLLPCGECELCLAGARHLCVRGPGMIVGIAHDGGMAEMLRVPESSLVRLPAGLDLRSASLVEPLAVGIHGMARARLLPGERVLIVGGGTIGLLAAVAARARGGEVDLFVRHEAQREAAAQLGLRVVDRVEGTWPVVVDAAGTQSALDLCAAAVRPGGRLVALAVYWDGLNFPDLTFALREVDVLPASLYNSQAGVRDVDAAAALLARDPRIGRALITHRFPLDAAAEAFRTAADRAAGAIKVVLEPG